MQFIKNAQGLTKPGMYHKWREFIWRSDLHKTTKQVAFGLQQFMHTKKHDCFPSQGKLAKATGLSRRAVITHLQRLEDVGYINIAKRPCEDGEKSRNHYFATIDGLDLATYFRDGTYEEGMMEDNYF